VSIKFYNVLAVESFIGISIVGNHTSLGWVQILDYWWDVRLRWYVDSVSYLGDKQAWVNYGNDIILIKVIDDCEINLSEHFYIQQTAILVQ
jgi:hypothetical protein